MPLPNSRSSLFNAIVSDEDHCLVQATFLENLEFITRLSNQEQYNLSREQQIDYALRLTQIKAIEESSPVAYDSEFRAIAYSLEAIANSLSELVQTIGIEDIDETEEPESTQESSPGR
jgi:hypothetical protein